MKKAARSQTFFDLIYLFSILVKLQSVISEKIK